MVPVPAFDEMQPLRRCWGAVSPSVNRHWVVVFPGKKMKTIFISYIAFLFELQAMTQIINKIQGTHSFSLNRVSGKKDEAFFERTV
jgi:hypothetical protein